MKMFTVLMNINQTIKMNPFSDLQTLRSPLLPLQKKNPLHHRHTSHESTITEFLSLSVIEIMNHVPRDIVNNHYPWWMTDVFFPSSVWREWRATSATCAHESSLCLPTWRDTCWSTTASDPSSVTSASRASSRNRRWRRTWSFTCLSNPSNARSVLESDRIQLEHEI